MTRKPVKNPQPPYFKVGGTYWESVQYADTTYYHSDGTTFAEWVTLWRNTAGEIIRAELHATEGRGIEPDGHEQLSSPQEYEAAHAAALAFIQKRR